MTMNAIDEIYKIYIACNQLVCTDTRKIEQGSLFFCLKGDNFNGNLFQDEALAKGAAWVIGDEKHSDSAQLILVEDSLKALQLLAAYHRTKLGTKLIGIGGSNGKTTTKELLVSVLSTRFKTHSTEGNFNNHIGVPLTLLKLRPEHEVSIVELGTNKAGDIQELCEIANPDMGIITNIGKEHLEGFGSMEGVAKAEGELFEHLKKINGHAFVNADDEWVRKMGESVVEKTMYSVSNPTVCDIRFVPTVAFVYRGQTFVSNLPGKHNFQNIMAVMAIAGFLGLNDAEIGQGIASYVPRNNRSQILQGDNGNTIFLDAYNANPSSVEMALGTLSEMPGKKWALLGDMFELGAYEAKEHQAICDLCASYDSIESVLVGKAFAATSNSDKHVHLFENKEEARKFIEKLNIADSMILIKGSRGMKMEELLSVFKR